MQIIQVDTKSLKQDPKNARKHSDKNLLAIVGSLKEFGQRKPIVVRGGTVLAGNGTLTAALTLGWDKIDVVLADELTDAQAKAYALSDNRTSELGMWDMDRLGESLQELREDGFDLNQIGFDVSDLDNMFPEFEPSSIDDQGKLDEKAKITCPACDHEFTP